MNNQKGQKGSVLIISLAISAIILILLGIFLGTIVVEKRRQQRSFRSNQALNLAEAGIEYGIWALNNEDITTWDKDETGNPVSSFTVDTSGEKIGCSTVAITSTTAAATITSTGSVSYASTNVEREVKVTAQATASSTVFDMAFFGGTDAGTGFSKTGSGKIDSYDSEGIGKLYPNKKGNGGHIGTNSKSASPKAVKITGSGNIDGNIYIGAGGDPDEAIQITGSAQVGGDTLALSENRELPELDLPTIPSLPDQGELRQTGSSDEYVHTSGRYSSISGTGSGDFIFDTNANFIYVEGDMKKTGSGDIIINSDMTLYVAGDFKFIGSGKLIVQNNHKLTIYVGGNITGTGSGLWNDSMNPLNLAIYGLDSCTQIKLTGSADLYGVIYARNAEIRKTGSGDIYGSIMGDTISITGSGDIHYDEALANPSLNPGAPQYKNFKFKPHSWQEIPSS